MKELVNDGVHLFKLTLLWPDDHLINQLAHALIERNAELAAIKAQDPTYWLDVHGYQTYLYFNEKDATEACSKNGGMYVKPVFDGPTVAEKQDAKAIEDNLIEQVGLMCDRAVNIHEKNVYGEAFCVLKYGILPYLRKKGK
ncbi:TPA: hypothetical protein P0N90_004187 [Yersinia enterocolitica]|uniref:hypothetical protein n=1 Tax=Yersinia enterocolitica TaxID=630 RepID=UPI0029847AC2|nr:hypothetical protein [Yersinia enterocolitica]HDL7792725.1 hypothetical protein [Yersinia enterocolitica]HDL8193087.1 hypothetical protein [Yersinia enterocolitica]HDM8376371.1 hypothetical protein [Yersinia enterocolitica]HDM9017898.1 hypothetical protein [Yersinia enterocolitica]